MAINRHNLLIIEMQTSRFNNKNYSNLSLNTIYGHRQIYCQQKVGDIGSIKILENASYSEVSIILTCERRVNKPCFQLKQKAAI